MWAWMVHGEEGACQVPSTTDLQTEDRPAPFRGTQHLPFAATLSHLLVLSQWVYCAWLVEAVLGYEVAYQKHLTLVAYRDTWVLWAVLGRAV